MRREEKRKHKDTHTFISMHIHICSFTCTFIYLNNPFASMLAISERCLYSLSCTSIVIMMNRNRAILSNEIKSNRIEWNQCHTVDYHHCVVTCL